MKELIITGEYIQPLLDILNPKPNLFNPKPNSIYLRSNEENIIMVHVYLLLNLTEKKNMIRQIPTDKLIKVTTLLSIGIDKYNAFNCLKEYMI